MSTGTSGITLGPRIKWAMERAGKSVDDLAAHFEVHEVSVYRWLRDDPRVNLERLEQIAEYLGRPMWWFFAPEEAIKETPPNHNGTEAYLEWLKGQAGAGSVDPSEMPAVEAAKMLAGYFRFGDRRIETHIVFNAKGPPGDFGGYMPPD